MKHGTKSLCYCGLEIQFVECPTGNFWAHSDGMQYRHTAMPAHSHNFDKERKDTIEFAFGQLREAHVIEATCHDYSRESLDSILSSVAKAITEYLSASREK